MKIILSPRSRIKDKAELLVAGFFEKEKLSPAFAALEPVFSKTLKDILDKGRFAGKSGEYFSQYGENHRTANEIGVVGLGPKQAYKAESLRKAAGHIAKVAQSQKTKQVRLFLDSFVSGNFRPQDAAGVIAEISLLAAYEFDKYKTKKDEKSSKKEITLEILSAEKRNEPGIRKAIEAGRLLADAVLFARNLVNEPANVMNAVNIAREAKRMAVERKIRCEILGEKDLRKLKMGGILAVNQGSPNPPALIVLEYGRQYKWPGTVCLVGKGVTFDTGGISIKPSKGMETMKYDMAGAASVIGIMRALSDLKLPRHVVALIPAVENNVAGNPQRPGDIIRMYNGKTVEVLNTDAEGRLILGDALAYAGRFKPKAIIDLATLTGMCLYTFADKAIGLLGNDERLLARIKRAGTETGERCWQLPLWEEYGESIKGHHSDLYNIGGPYAGTITAAMFLQQFVPEKTAWAHLDIAGTAWCESSRYDASKGATGVGVRLVMSLLRNWK